MLTIGFVMYCNITNICICTETFLKDIHKSIVVASREKTEQEGELCSITYTSGVIFVNHVQILGLQI